MFRSITRQTCSCDDCYNVKLEAHSYEAGVWQLQAGTSLAGRQLAPVLLLLAFWTTRGGRSSCEVQAKKSSQAMHAKHVVLLTKQKELPLAGVQTAAMRCQLVRACLRGKLMLGTAIAAALCRLTSCGAHCCGEWVPHISHPPQIIEQVIHAVQLCPLYMAAQQSAQSYYGTTEGSLWVTPASVATGSVMRACTYLEGR